VNTQHDNAIDNSNDLSFEILLLLYMIGRSNLQCFCRCQ